MRIFLGTTEIAGQLSIWAQGFRALGHEVTTGVHTGHTYYFAPETRYDVYIRPNDTAQIVQIMQNHDIFFFQWGHSLLPDNADYPLLRQADKKIGCIFNGSDVRFWPAYEETHGVDVKDYYEGEKPQMMGDAYYTTALGRLRRAELYADAIFSIPDTMSLALRPYQNFYATLNCHDFTPKIHNRDVPIVIHAPSKKAIKGTKMICHALEELKSEGVPFDLRLLHDVHNSVILQELENADCVIDQQLGLGLFAREAMASGCAVASGYYEADIMNNYIPYFKLHKGKFKDGLKEFLLNKKMRLSLAEEGVKHVHEYYDASKFCSKMLHDVLVEEEQRVYDYYPRYFATRFSPPENTSTPTKYIEMQDAIVQKWGLPHDADPIKMCKKGLLSPQSLQKNIPLWEEELFDLATFSEKKIKKGIPFQSIYTDTLPKSVEDIFNHCQRYKKLLTFIKAPYTLEEDVFVKEILQHIERQKIFTQKKFISLSKFLLGIHLLNLENSIGKTLITKSFEDYKQTQAQHIILCHNENATQPENDILYLKIEGLTFRQDYLTPSFLKHANKNIIFATIFYILAQGGYYVTIQSDTLPYAQFVNSLLLNRSRC